MDTLVEGDRIILLISEHYFKSRFCMHELDLIYSKRAGDLRPCNVLMGGLDPNPDMEAEVIDYWHQQAGKKDKNNSDAAKRYRDFAKNFPVLMAWLFGAYDAGLEYRHLLRIQMPDTLEQASVEKIVALLERTGTRLRYSHFSDLQRKSSIKKKIEKCLSRGEGKILRRFLADEHSWEFSRVADKLADLGDAESWIKIFQDLIVYLDGLEDKEMKPHAKARACNYAEEFFGLWLIRGVDTQQLHILIHDLNNQRDAARKVFNHDEEYCYPILVSALFNIPVYYYYRKESWESSAVRFPLSGKHQLQLGEHGLNPDSYKKSLEKETLHMSELCPFEEAVRKVDLGEECNSPLTGTKDERYEDLKLMASGLEGLYMLFSQDVRVSGAKVHTLLTLFGREFPWITQIGTARTSEGGCQKIMTYFIKGVNPTTLQRYILKFYKRIREITDEQK